jgi:hypothetical protein
MFVKKLNNLILVFKFNDIHIDNFKATWEDGIFHECIEGIDGRVIDEK